MPEFNPESFMDVEAYEFYGPNYKELKQQYEGKPAPAQPTQNATQQVLKEEPVSEPQSRVSDAQEAPEEPLTDDVDVSFSEIYRDITASVGPEEADAVHEFMNNNSSQEEIADYMEYLNAGDQEAVALFQAAKIAKDAGYEGSGEIESTGLSEEAMAGLLDRFGDVGEVIIGLNSKLVNGDISAAEMKLTVMSDAALLRSCLQAKELGFIHF